MQHINANLETQLGQQGTSLADVTLALTDQVQAVQRELEELRSQAQQPHSHKGSNQQGDDPHSGGARESNTDGNSMNMDSDLPAYAAIADLLLEVISAAGLGKQGITEEEHSTGGGSSDAHGGDGAGGLWYEALFGQPRGEGGDSHGGSSSSDAAAGSDVGGAASAPSNHQQQEHNSQQQAADGQQSGQQHAGEQQARRRLHQAVGWGTSTAGAGRLASALRLVFGEVINLLGGEVGVRCSGCCGCCGWCISSQVVETASSSSDTQK